MIEPKLQKVNMPSPGSATWAYSLRVQKSSSSEKYGHCGRRGWRIRVEGEWRFESPEALPNRIPFTLRLSHDLHPLSLKEFVRLEWQSDSGPLTCRGLSRLSSTASREHEIRNI